MATDPRFLEKLEEQLGFIRQSCATFDAGFEAEALRIATALRVVFHQTLNSTSLVTHLGFNSKAMLSSSRGHNDWRDYLAFVENLNSATPIVMKPLLGINFHSLAIPDWWEGETIFVHKAKPYSRKKIVLSMANKDGGAHVDADLEEYYEVLCSGEWGIGITGDLEFDGPEPFPQGVTFYGKNGHLALVRQFGHEVLCTANNNGWLR